ncbi:MAG: hypothetical protein QOG60_2641 [Frankiaceae bacterium]|nr:hypothetical protein [Frankiaceae bacterium]
MLAVGDNESDDPALPPAAPAYDFRTGRPLHGPPQPAPAWRPSEDGDELGIWAPQQQAEPSWGAPAAPTGGQPQQPAYQQPAYQQQPYQQPGSWGPTADNPSPSRAGGNRTLVLVLLLGALLAVGALVALILLTRNSSPSAGQVAGIGSSPSSSGSGAASPNATSPSAASSGATSSGGAQGDGARAAFARDVDGILRESSDGRRQVVAAITGVRNGCAVSPSDATSTLTDVIANRQSVLARANALTTPDAATTAAKADLVQALTASLEANEGYQRWLDSALAAAPDTTPAGCPGGRVPPDDNYATATDASDRASGAKRQFVAAYNPIATQAGLTTWTADQF